MVVICNVSDWDPVRKRIVDDSGFPRTPDRPIKLLGTRVRYQRSVETTIDARGPDFSGGSAITTNHASEIGAFHHHATTKCSPFLCSSPIALLSSSHRLEVKTEPAQQEYIRIKS